MNIGGSEWLIIGLLVVILLFGSKKLPEFSRAIGKAMGEYEKMRTMTLNQKTIDKDSRSNPNYSNSGYFGPRIVNSVDSERQKLERIVESLGIDYVDKNDDELRTLIFDKINR